MFHLSNSLCEKGSFVVVVSGWQFSVVLHICGTSLHLFDKYLKASYVTGVYFSAGR